MEKKESYCVKIQCVAMCGTRGGMNFSNEEKRELENIGKL